MTPRRWWRCARVWNALLILDGGWAVRVCGPGGVVGVGVSARGGAGSPRTSRAWRPRGRRGGCTRRCPAEPRAAGGLSGGAADLVTGGQDQPVPVRAALGGRRSARRGRRAAAPRASSVRRAGRGWAVAVPTERSRTRTGWRGGEFRVAFVAGYGVFRGRSAARRSRHTRASRTESAVPSSRRRAARASRAAAGSWPARWASARGAARAYQPGSLRICSAGSGGASRSWPAWRRSRSRGRRRPRCAGVASGAGAVAR